MPTVDATLRYRLAAPLSAPATTWVDLGLGDDPADGAPEALHVNAAGADPVAALRAAAGDAQDALITCFGTFDELPDVAPLLTSLLELAAAGATVLISVRDRGAAEELRRLLPAGAVTLKQRALRGSVIAVDGADADLSTVTVPEDLAASEQIIAFGAGVKALATVASVVATDVNAEQDEVRALRSSVTYLEARVAQLEADRTPAG